MRSIAVAILSLILVGSANAVTVPMGYDNAGSAIVVAGAYGPSASYDPATNTLSISGAATYFFGPGRQASATGFQTLEAKVDQDGSFLGGTYTFSGADPALGIDTTRVLLAATITGISISVLDSHPIPSIGMSNGELSVDVEMDTVFSDPAIGNWGSKMFFGAGGSVGFLNSGPFPSLTLTDETLYKYAWAGLTIADSWDLKSFKYVPEPRSLALVLVALVALFGGRGSRGRGLG